MKTKLFALVSCSVMAANAPLDAATLDLNASGPLYISTTYGTAIFKALSPDDPAGTGVFDPFLSIQKLPANGGEQEGYNSVLHNFDTKREPTWNYDIRLSDIPTITLDDDTYYSFVIDVNEPNAGVKALISLDALQIFTKSTPTAYEITDAANLGELGTLRFDLDLPEDTFIKYDDVNQGSGRADIAFYIPTSAFDEAGADDYFYMYQHWGELFDADGEETVIYEVHAGFEETAFGLGDPLVPGGGPTNVPEPTNVLALGALLAMGLLRRSRR